MKNFLKKYQKYFFFFLSFLFFNLFLSPLNLDEVWSYGFSHNLYTGEIPYLDFNMVITPFHPFCFTFLMPILGDSLFTFHLENTLIIVFFIWILFSLLDKKAWLLLPLLIFPLNITFPNYNFFLLFLFFLYIYGEEKQWPDFIMGLLLGILFLTKQSVGFIFLFSLCRYHKNRKKVHIRLIYFWIPLLIFIIYLIGTNSLLSFLDLCIFGLFDFGKGNGNITIFFFTTIFLIFLSCWFFQKDHQKIYFMYFLLFLSICIPLFDLYHFQIALLAFCAIYLYYLDISKINPKRIGMSLTIGLMAVYFFHTSFDGIYPNSFSHFEYRYLSPEFIKTTEEVLSIIHKYDDKVMFIGPTGYYFKLIRNEKIGKLDLINTGNFGYDGSNKLLNQVKKLDSSYVFFVSKDEVGYGKQTDQKLIKYILKNGIYLEEGSGYSIYRLDDVYD